MSAAVGRSAGVGAGRRIPWPQRESAIAWQASSLLLDYPSDDNDDTVRLAERAAAGLPHQLGDGLLRVCRRLRSTPRQQLQADYVETFDSRRRCNLYLTYFSYGDTRRRGAALLQFKQTYQRHGFDLVDAGPRAELPDHLCVVLEFAATVDAGAGLQLLLDHRAGLELLRISLRDSGSTWAPILQTVSATLPPLRGDEQQAVRRLAAQGPPAEEVGLAPYAVDGAGTGVPVDLPMPVRRGAGRRSAARGVRERTR